MKYAFLFLLLPSCGPTPNENYNRIETDGLKIEDSWYWWALRMSTPFSKFPEWERLPVSAIKSRGKLTVAKPAPALNIKTESGLKIGLRWPDFLTLTCEVRQSAHWACADFLEMDGHLIYCAMYINGIERTAQLECETYDNLYHWGLTPVEERGACF